MKAAQLTEAIVAMQRAYDFIATNVAPGKFGKVDVMSKLASAGRHLSYELPETAIPVELPAVNDVSPAIAAQGNLSGGLKAAA